MTSQTSRRSGSGDSPEQNIGSDRIIGVRSAVFLTSVTTVLAVVLVVVVMLLGRADVGASQDQYRRAELRSAVPSMVAGMLSVESDAWQADRERAATHLADEFSSGYGELLAGPPPPGIEHIRWLPVNGAVIENDGERGEMLVAFEVRTTPAAGDVLTARRTLVIRVAYAQGSWRVTGLEVMA